ncbi:phasin family protein [Brevundimonas bullata]|uniref:phasin family protein n=1 Tax=Brevundimonas bullata TaxID=13160 RepID=UPI0019CCD305|nr:phasin family protein [Brevundimonas sp.]
MNPIDRAARTIRAGQETAEASAKVIARRLAIMGEAMANPLRADHAELGRMGPEKVQAMTASAGAVASGAMDLADQGRRIADREGAEASAHMTRLASADNLASAAALQAAWGMGVWSRALSDSWTMGESMLKLQAKALSPIHAAAVANARRLKP